MNFGRLGRGEYLAVLGGLLLALEPLPAVVRDEPGQSQRDDRRRPRLRVRASRPSRSCAGCCSPRRLAPLILAWIILRDHQLSWPRGEMTAVVGMIAIVLVLYVGFVDRPGTPSSQISLKLGWFVAVARLRADRPRRRDASGRHRTTT